MEFSLIEVWEAAPLINKFILAFMGIMSVWSIFVMIERGLTYFKGSRESYSYVLALRDYLSKHQVNEAITAAKRHQKSPVSKVVESGLLAYKQGLEALEQKGPHDVGDQLSGLRVANLHGERRRLPGSRSRSPTRTTKRRAIAAYRPSWSKNGASVSGTASRRRRASRGARCWSRSGPGPLRRSTASSAAIPAPAPRR